MKKTMSKQKWGPVIKRVLGPNVPWLWFLLTVIAGMIMSHVNVNTTEMAGRIMGGEIFDVSLLIQYVLLTTVSLIISNIITISRVVSCYCGERNIQRSLWRKMVHMPMRRYDRQAPSSLISRVTSDPLQVHDALIYLMNTVNATYALILMLSRIWGMNHSITLALLLAIPYILLVMIVPGRFFYRARARVQEALSRFTTFVAERLANITLVKSAANEDADLQMGYGLIDQCYKADVKSYLVAACAYPFQQSTNGVVSAIVLIMGGILVNQGKLAMEDLITMYMYSSSICVALMTYVGCFQSLKQAQGSVAVIGEIMDAPDETLEREKSFTQPDADIVFDNVSFGYSGRKVLKDIDLTIHTGKITAIVGPSGAGKTTLLSLLERLYTPDEGQVRFGDIPVEEIHLGQWREAMGYIQQNSPLLSGTIRDNIVYGLNHSVKEEEVINAAKLANAYPFIMKLPQGFDTNVGELGGKLSGGERQRIAIARMIIKDPDYLLLDEATSSLDAENEAEVQSALANIMKGRTAVVVAHNLRTVKNADYIVVMDEGQVQAVGDHETLYKTNAIYQKYCDLQFGRKD